MFLVAGKDLLEVANYSEDNNEERPDHPDEEERDENGGEDTDDGIHGSFYCKPREKWMLDFICDATNSSADVGHGGALGDCSSPSFSRGRPGARLADDFLLDCDFAVVVGADPR